MKITGGATLHAPVGTVWTALNDPAILVRAIPGCERLTATAPDTYQLTVTAGVGTITGTYTGEIALTPQQPPSAFLLTATGSGGPGTVSTSVQVRLADDGNGATQLTYDADATVGGVIAGVGQRMLTSVARRQATQFFTAIDELLLTRAAPAQPAAPPEGVRPGGAAGVSSPTAAAPPGASGTTWERPTADRQPAGRLGARPPTGSFLTGVAAGAAIALAGVIVGGLIARRKR
ncbi:MAG TPA: carbon monoxide dehydrogenase subunit G [Streptosporangiaceae bacterium]|jgi:carbon monoxide dehydrogenase subunit G|nr:carbon monoxide dehydrogenase subunit G [Streptosporangiaceae bacterium]